MDAAAELGRNPVISKHQIQPDYGDEQADAGGTGRLNPSRETKLSGTHGDRGLFIFPVQLTTSRTRLIHTLLYVMTIHTYIQYHNNYSIYFITPFTKKT